MLIDVTEAQFRSFIDELDKKFRENGKILTMDDDFKNDTAIIFCYAKNGINRIAAREYVKNPTDPKIEWTKGYEINDRLFDEFNISIKNFQILAL